MLPRAADRIAGRRVARLQAGRCRPHRCVIASRQPCRLCSATFWALRVDIVRCTMWINSAWYAHSRVQICAAQNASFRSLSEVALQVLSSLALGQCWKSHVIAWHLLQRRRMKHLGAQCLVAHDVPVLLQDSSAAAAECAASSSERCL